MRLQATVSKGSKTAHIPTYFRKMPTTEYALNPTVESFLIVMLFYWISLSFSFLLFPRPFTGACWGHSAIIKVSRLLPGLCFKRGFRLYKALFRIAYSFGTLKCITQLTVKHITNRSKLLSSAGHFTLISYRQWNEGNFSSPRNRSSCRWNIIFIGKGLNINNVESCNFYIGTKSLKYTI